VSTGTGRLPPATSVVAILRSLAEGRHAVEYSWYRQYTRQYASTLTQHMFQVSESFEKTVCILIEYGSKRANWVRALVEVVLSRLAH
jgi:hypothetical protein